MARTDVHSPTNLVTEDYEFAACGNYATAEIDAYSPLATSHKYLIDEGWRFANVDQEGGGGCQHCGSFLIYYAILKHIPSHTLLRVGEQCLDNRFALATSEFQKLRKNAKLNRDRVRLSDKRAEWLAADPDNAAAFAYATAQVEAGNHGMSSDDGMAEGFYEKFLRFVKTYGEASEKFVAAILRSEVREREWAERKAREAADAKPVEVGKQQITGEVLSVKWRDTQYGSTLKMVVRDDRGFKVWGTVPAAIEDVEIEHGHQVGLPTGARVSFTATITVSDDDPCFGFFKRPTKPSIISLPDGYFPIGTDNNNSEELSHA